MTDEISLKGISRVCQVSRKQSVAPVEEFPAVWWRYGVCPIFARRRLRF